MSISVPEQCLSPQHMELIQKLLIIKPKEKFIPQKKGNRFQKPKTSKSPICLFNADLETRTITLPFSFARTLLNLPAPNHHPQYPYQFTESLYESQIQVVNDAIVHLTKYQTTTLNLYTSFGKTVIGSYLGAALGKITLVFYSQTILEPQWYSTFKDFTNAVIWVVGASKYPVPDKPANVILCMDTRIHYLPDELLSQVGTVIYDEIDTFCTPVRVKCFLKVKPSYIIAATATLEREDGLHSAIQAVCGTHKIKKISTKPFIVYKYNTGIKIDIKLDRFGTPDWSKFTLDQAQSERRNDLIEQLIYCNMNMKILVLTWRAKEHAIPLTYRLKSKKYHVDYMAGTKKTYQDSHVLVGTISKLGRGFDEKAACDCFNGNRINLLILVGSTQSIPLLEQLAGRVFRSDFPQIIHMVDDVSISKNHWKKARPWYKSRNGTIIELDSPYVSSSFDVQGKINPSYLKNSVSEVDPNLLVDEQLRQFQDV